ncbi:secretin N-terminal domain-containing protein [Candidatus Omnitrophota bacterium]
MKRSIRLYIAIIFTFFITHPSIAADTDYTVSSKAGPSLDNMVSMDFQDADLKTVLKIFSQQAGLNFVASQNIQDRTLTLYFDNVTVEDALSHIMNANNLIYEQRSGSNIFIVKESGRPPIETVTKIYELKYAQLTKPPDEDDGGGSDDEEEEAEILEVIRDLLSDGGTLVVDKRSNSLIVTDVPSQFTLIEDVLLRLDVRTRQVMIEAEVIETTTTVADRLGMDWTGGFGVYAGSDLATKWPFKGALIDKDLITTDGTMKFSGMGFTLRALLSDSDTRILARPKVLTLNNEKAVIKLTSETAVASITTSAGEGSGATVSTSAERIKTGITLEVTPQINKDGYITMHVEPTVIVPVASATFAGSGNDAKFVDPQTRSTKTTVMVRDGETLVIGGLISRDDTYVFEKIPFLGDLPFLGAAFRYKSKDETDKELLIFITPRIIKEIEYALEDISEREQEKPRAVREKKIRGTLDLVKGWQTNQ